LNDNDPLFTAGASAGAQLVGSLSTEALRNPAKTFIGMAALMLATREAIPGFDPGVFEAIDASANKVGLGIVTGLLTALPASRLSGRNQSAATAVLLDAISTLPRASMQSVLDSVIETMRSGTDSAKKAAQSMLNQVDTVTDEQISRFEKAFKSGDAGEFDALAEDLADVNRTQKTRGTDR